MRALLIFLLLPFWIQAQEIAFPGAEGFGKNATGGRDGKVLIVKNLNDSGPGSLREALDQEYPRIVVFNISGTIKLKSELDITKGNVSILGHSAPGEGITLRDYPLKVTGAENVIIRYIRSRLGDETNYQGDAISIMRSKNVIVDHCSFSWSSDEVATFYENENSTVQYCIASESLNNSVHEKGEHGYGGIWGGMNASFHHNLLAHHKSRSPRFQGARWHKQPDKEIVDFRNNVIYNWQANNSYGGEEGNHNIVNNMYKPGPASGSKQDMILDPYKPFGKFYVSGNILMGNEEVTKDNWKGVKHYDENSNIRLAEPLSVAPIPTEDSFQAFEKVLAQSGASFCRDEVDKRVIKEVANGNSTFGTGIIDSQKDVGGWPKLKSGTPINDIDLDGMDDEWERLNGLDPADNSDAIQRTLNKGYSNIEVYLNSRLEKDL